MLNKTKFTIISAVVLAFTFTQTVKAQEQKEHKELTEWAELKNFHKVISKTFHPMEEGNLQPIHERSAELHEQAVLLAASKVPADLNRPEILSAVKELESETKELDNLVQKKAPDEEVKKLLTIVHDSFHKIVGLCTKGEDPHEHEGK